MAGTVLLAWAAAAGEDLNNLQASTTAGAWPFDFERLRRVGGRGVLPGWSGCLHVQQLPRPGDRFYSVAVGQKSSMADAVSVTA